MIAPIKQCGAVRLPAEHSLRWLSGQVPAVSRVGKDLHGILWQGNCFAFSYEEPTEYWRDLQEILWGLSAGL